MTLILLIRHALTDATGRRLSGQAPGIHLSEQGKEQAARLAERLAPLSLAALYSSPLERCLETAEPIVARRGLEIRQLPAILEVDYGRWTGRPLKALARTSLWSRIQHAPSSIRFPDGETLTEVQRRGAAALDEIAARHRRSTVAVVTHADVIRLVVAHYAGVHIDLFQRIIVSPASITAIALGERVPRLVRLNDTGTVEDLKERATSRPQAAARPPSRKGP